MKCPKCDPKVGIEPQVREGKPIKDGDDVYTRLIFKCVNPQCENYNKDIGELKIDLFDNSKQIEILY